MTVEGDEEDERVILSRLVCSLHGREVGWVKIIECHRTTLKDLVGIATDILESIDKSHPKLAEWREELRSASYWVS